MSRYSTKYVRCSNRDPWQWKLTTEQWSRPLGLPEHPLSFQDLFSLDEDFLSFIPLPVKAVLLLFPAKGELQAAREKEEQEAPEWTGKDVWWIKQTVS